MRYLASDFTKLAPETSYPVKFGMTLWYGAARPTLYLKIDIFEQLGGTGVMADLSIGNKPETKHLLRVERDPEGPFKMAAMGKRNVAKNYRVFLPVMQDCPVKKIRPANCRYELDGGAIYINMPPWVWNKQKPSQELTIPEVLG